MRTKHINRLSKAKWFLLTILFYKRLFYRIGSRSVIMRPLQFNSTSSVSVGNDTTIAQFSWLMGNDDATGSTLVIGNDVRIGHFAHIVAKHSVVIEDSVLIADKVFISDCSHVYEDILVPVLYQSTCNLNSVVIGEGSWIGENVCVFGAKIGKHCIIGANSVVSTDIPDYSVAVGAPAKVIKKYNAQLNIWEKA